ncbi:hypothetical protein HPP92_004416 [Vanilla planifolia]|uniref:FAD-binding domain-containing protein n=1 Tax=Vanilla planifolia TaxID=51239 RepID=A0A835S3L4_VANPL|nr:hypothetical protein HPP92_004416 [Vanilla planifolia]
MAATSAAEKVEELVIVGGGIAGLATAVALQRLGKRCLVLERWHEVRQSGAALTLFPNAWRALDALGVGHKLRPHYYLLRTGTITNLANGVTQHQSFVSKGASGEEMGPRVVHRKALLEAIAEELPPECIRFSSKLSSITTEVLNDSSTVVVLTLEDGDIIKAKAVIGCDGVHSVVAQWLGLSPPRNSSRSAVRGLAVFPEGHGLKLQGHQFLSPGVRTGFVPVNKNDVYWFTAQRTTPKMNEMGRDPELILKWTLEELVGDVPEEFKEVVLRTTPESLSYAQLTYRAPWNVFIGRAQRGCVTVAGDAMHPTTPDLGQGGCISLEDAVVLARCLARACTAKEMEDAMAQYVGERRARAAWVITVSFFSGFVQQASGGLWAGPMRLFRDLLFYRLIFPMILGIARYDCGRLPEPSEA